MKNSLSALCLMVVLLAAGPAYALDCKKASTKLEHQICADKGLMKADAAMTAAYLTLLHLAADPDIRLALINSQRRWIAARERDLGNLGDREVLLDATASRTKDLSAQVDGKPQFIVAALKQRAGVATYSGGPFSGYDGSCSFIPDQQNNKSYTYNCFGTRSVQNGERVCFDNQDFATYSSVERRAVANIIGGKPKIIATCAINSGRDTECPEEDGAGKATQWNLHPTPEQASIGDGSANLIKLDPDLAALDDDQTWLQSCLTDKSFPASTSAAPHSTAQ